jgi:hypothetical protein
MSHDLTLQGPSQSVRLDAPAGLTVFEFKNDAALVGILFLDPVASYRPAVERRLCLLPVKVDVTPDEFLRFVLPELPPAAFPYLVAQFDEIVRVFDQMDLHVIHSLYELYNKKPRLAVSDRASRLPEDSLFRKIKNVLIDVDYAGLRLS